MFKKRLSLILVLAILFSFVGLKAYVTASNDVGNFSQNSAQKFSFDTNIPSENYHYDYQFVENSLDIINKSC